MKAVTKTWIIFVLMGLAIECLAQTSNVEDLEERIDQLEKELQAIKKSNNKDKKEQKKEEAGLLFSGFFDVMVSERRSNPNTFELGDFELDMDHQLGDHFQVGAALVFNQDESELAVGFIDYHIYGGMIPSRGRLFDQKGLHVQLGKFDIPFGNDWEYYASADRPNIFAPLTTEEVIDGGYNDTGLRVLQASASWNYTVYVVRGRGEGNAYGGRFEITPFDNPFSFRETKQIQLEAGISYLNDTDRSELWEERAWGLDILFTWRDCQFIAEWLESKLKAEQETRRGYQFTAVVPVYNLPWGFIQAIGRYDEAQHVYSNLETRRASLAISMDFHDVSSLKVEVLEDLDHHDSQIHAQVVVKF